MRGIDPLDYHVNHFPWGLPRMRGSTYVTIWVFLEGQRLPRMAGIDLSGLSRYESVVGLPPMSGDRPPG